MENREIKFRAWHEGCKAKTGRSADIAPQMLFAGDNKGTRHPLDCCRYAAEGQPVTLMQYTGLKDKNGREIYEGDIVKIGGRAVGSIEYGECRSTADDNYCAGECFGFHVNKQALGNSEVWDGRHTTGDNLEVIGNIFENPELLQPAA